jgi:hypothetical protein
MPGAWFHILATKIEGIHERLHGMGIQGRCIVAADAIDRVARDAAFAHEQLLAALGVHDWHREPWSLRHVRGRHMTGMGERRRQSADEGRQRYDGNSPSHPRGRSINPLGLHRPILCAGVDQLLHETSPADRVIPDQNTTCIDLDQPWPRKRAGYPLATTPEDQPLEQRWCRGPGERASRRDDFAHLRQSPRRLSSSISSMVTRAAVGLLPEVSGTCPTSPIATSSATCSAKAAFVSRQSGSVARKDPSTLLSLIQSRQLCRA